MLKGLLEMGENTIKALLHGDILLLLRGAQPDTDGCLAHYVHFWHIFIVALEHDIPMLYRNAPTDNPDGGIVHVP